MGDSLSKAEREKIFGLFIKKHNLKFSEIEKEIGIRSNALAYHLEQMVKDELLEKQGSAYKLTDKAEKMIPFFAHLTGKEVGALPVVLVAILNKKRTKICLLKRAKRPYKDYWGVIGGKLKLEESIEETAVRESKEETNLLCKFEKINAVLHERVRENNNVKHAFVLFFTTVIAENEDSRCSEEGNVQWFELSKLDNEKIIPSDMWMLKNCLKSKSDLKQVLIEEENQELKNLEVR